MKKIFALFIALMLFSTTAFAAVDVIQEYDMTSAGGYSSYGTVQHIDDGTGNKYLSLSAGYVTFPYAAVASGAYNIEFEIKIPNGNQTVTAALLNSDESVSIAAKNWNWVNNDGDTDSPNCGWVTIKFEIDVDAGTIAVYKENTLQFTRENQTGLEGLCKIRFTRWGETCYLDNLMVYRPLCEVSAYSFSDAEGNTYADIDDSQAYPNRINITFATEMNTATVTPVLEKNGSEIAYNPSWDTNDKVLSIYPNDTAGVFEYGAEYRLTIPAGFADKGGSVCNEEYVLEFERTAMAGAIANFDMESAKSGITGSYNTRDYKTDENGRKYLEICDDNVALEFSEPVTSGTVTLEFEFANVVSDNNIHTSVWLTESGTAGGNKASFMEIKGSKTAADGEIWIKYKLVVDFENDEIAVYENDEFSQTITGKDINALSQFKGIGFTRWGGKSVPKYFGIDNLKAYISESSITGYTFRDFGGSEADRPDELSEAVECVVVEFANEPVLGTLEVTMFNHKSEQNESVVLETNGRYLTIRPTKGYFDAGSDFDLTIADSYTNKYGYIGTNGLDTSFNSGSKVFGLKEMNILKDGTAIQLSDVNAGDELKVELVYVLTDAMQPVKAIVALTCENNFAVTSFENAVITLNQPGLITVQYPFTVKAGAEFDTIYAYIWDVATRVPKMNCTVVAE